jgi:glycosyltransferase involved in cell wall biosynthesis
MLDPLGQTQVLPYLRQLADVGVDFTLLSFERPLAYTDEGRERCRRLHDELEQHRIHWHWLPYHKTPSLPATAYDVFAGYRLAKRLVRDRQIELVHARSHIPATIALGLKRRLGTKMIFDVRGLMADEYVDANHWRKDSMAYRLTKNAERHALTAADGVVTLTQSIWDVIRNWDGLRHRNVPHAVVPCCADLEVFRFDEGARAQRRNELGVEDRFVIVYSGSIDGWYLTEEMADFFVTLRQRDARAHFLWLTTGSHQRIRDLMHARELTDSDYTVHTVAAREVTSYLSASDAGLAFIKPCFSKLASSPTKFAEYLGCGLPLVINRGIGDSDSLANENHIATMISDFNRDEYARAADELLLMTTNPEQTRQRARGVAQRLFDVRGLGAQRYVALYERVFNQ